MRAFKVIDGGILSLVQDKGRFGLCDKGITNSGVMDEYAYNVLNKILQNPNNTNCIEITLGGLKLEALGHCTVGICGAGGNFNINEIRKESWRTHNISKGDILSFNFATDGVRTYFGVKGGFDIKKELGSNSVTIKENIGKKLEKNDILNFVFQSIQDYNICLQKEYIPIYGNKIILRVILGYQKNYFSNKEIENFFSQTYTISSQNNRMGYKLIGNPIYSNFNGIISEGISYGAIQIPKDGQPIILLKERQTIGGYPKIGSVLPVDCFSLSQMKANHKVKFKPVDINEAQKIMDKFYYTYKTNAL